MKREIPNIVDLTVEEARTQLEDLGYCMRIIEKDGVINRGNYSAQSNRVDVIVVNNKIKKYK